MTQQPATDFDTPWKEILETYFPDFIAFFLPQTHPQIDWNLGFAFLDKELQQVAPDAELGKCLVDKLVKIYQEEEFWQQVNQFEEERQMPYITSVERRGIEQGIQQGQVSTLLRQLKRKFGQLNPEIETQIQNLASPQLEDLSEALLDFASMDDLVFWLSNQR